MVGADVIEYWTRTGGGGLFLLNFQRFPAKEGTYAQIRPSAAQVPPGGDRKSLPLLQTQTFLAKSDKEEVTQTYNLIEDLIIPEILEKLIVEAFDPVPDETKPAPFGCWVTER